MTMDFPRLPGVGDLHQHSDHYRHDTGFKHINIATSDSHFSAVFFIATPSLDDSGLAHAMEHMVFRRSQAFNDPCFLFQLTALLDIGINASTANGTSYFHCTSNNKVYFELALDYLLNGLIWPCFSDDDLYQEVSDGDCHGVIHRELAGYESDQHYLKLAEVLRGDKSQQRINHYGGYTDSIGKITTEQLRCYHRQYYQPANITLITSNADTTHIHQMINRCLIDYVAIHNNDCIHCLGAAATNHQANNSQTSNHQASDSQPLSQSISQSPKTDSNPVVINWWLPQSYLEYFQLLAGMIATSIEPLGAELLPPVAELNQDNEFALRIIVTPAQITSTRQRLLELVEHHPVPSENVNRNCRKYSQTIRQIIALFHHLYDENDDPVTRELLDALAQPPLLNPLDPVTPPATNDSDKQDRQLTNFIKHAQPSKLLPSLGELTISPSVPASAIKASPEQTDQGDPLVLWTHPLLNTPAVASWLNKKFKVSALSFANTILLQQRPVISIDQLDDRIATNTRLHQPQLPSLFHELYWQLLPKPSTHCQRLLGQHSEPSRIRALLNGALPDDRIRTQSDKLNWLCLVPISESHIMDAWLASYIISAYPGFIASRTLGRCYSIQCRFLDNISQLAFFSAFDVQPTERTNHVTNGLQQLCKESEFIQSAMPLAQHKLTGLLGNTLALSPDQLDIIHHYNHRQLSLPRHQQPLANLLTDHLCGFISQLAKRLETVRN